MTSRANLLVAAILALCLGFGAGAWIVRHEFNCVVYPSANGMTYTEICTREVTP
jgi:hypothetical protein